MVFCSISFVVFRTTMVNVYFCKFLFDQKNENVYFCYYYHDIENYKPTINHTNNKRIYLVPLELSLIYIHERKAIKESLTMKIEYKDQIVLELSKSHETKNSQGTNFVK